MDDIASNGPVSLSDPRIFGGLILNLHGNGEAVPHAFDKSSSSVKCGLQGLGKEKVY